LHIPRRKKKAGEREIGKEHSRAFNIEVKREKATSHHKKEEDLSVLHVMMMGPENFGRSAAKKRVSARGCCCARRSVGIRARRRRGSSSILIVVVVVVVVVVGR
jgi:hypothetical protein